MPRDDWKRANDRKRYGPSGATRLGLPKPVPRDRVFTVPPGVKCLVKRPNGSKWETHFTQTESTFERYNPINNGAMWEFVRPDGWRLRVHPKDVKK